MKNMGLTAIIILHLIKLKPEKRKERSTQKNSKNKIIQC